MPRKSTKDLRVRMSRRKQTPIEYVEWEDHCSLEASGWKDKKDATDLTPEICKTVGFVLKETSISLLLVSSIAGHQVDGEVCIIKKTIVKRQRLQ